LFTGGRAGNSISSDGEVGKGRTYGSAPFSRLGGLHGAVPLGVEQGAEQAGQQVVDGGPLSASNGLDCRSLVEWELHAEPVSWAVSDLDAACRASPGDYAGRGVLDPNRRAGGGNTVCTSATFSGDHCDAKINNTNQCIYFQNVNKTICKLITAFSSSYQTQPGDSGGPVFNRAGTTPDSGPQAYARGMLVGAYSANPGVFAYTGTGEVQQQLNVGVLGG